MLKLDHVNQLIIIIFFFISLSAAADLILKNDQSISRRILHQPLFPATSSPPPELDPPPPPPPDTTFPNPDQPFFPEVPTGPTPDQSRSTISPPPRNETAAANPIAAQPAKPVKKYAIVLSVAIVSLGMLSALVFYIYKHKSRHQMDTIKLVAPNFRDESRFQQPPPQNFLYIGTVEPTRPTMAENHNAIGSPYRKLKPDRYRPSPELQPLPPLTKPPPPIIDSPPPMSSSDDDDEDEAHDQTAFYTPQDSSSASIGENSHNSSSRRSYNSSRWTSKIKLEDEKTNTFPKSKRTSPKSRLSNSSPDSKQRIPTPSSPPVAEIRPFSRPKFSPPLPAPNMALLRSNQTPKTQIPPPPPPPPPPPQIPSLTPRKLKPIKRESPIPSSELQSKPLIMKPISVELKGRTTDEEEEIEEGGRPKLKALHWDKVRATSDRATVWDQLKSSSFKLNEDMMESLFGCKSAPKETAAATTTTTARRLVMPSEQENRVLDPKKSQNIAILLRALNVTRDEVSEALLVGNPEGLGVELLETLVKMAPTKEEEIKLRDYNGDVSKLGSAERFLKGILDIPFAFKRVEAMLYRANFDAEVKYLRNSFQTLEIASEELKNSRLFLKLLEAVLQTGNRMNVGTNRGDAKAFKLETLLKLVDIKGTDGKTTLLHFVVQEIIRSEGVLSDSSTKIQNSSPIILTMTEEDFKKQGLRVVSGLSKELANVKQAAGMDSDVLNSYLMKLETGLVKVRKMVMENEKQGGRFFESMKLFMEQEADNEIKRIKAEERKALSVVKDVTEYFHGDKGKVEAHPLRIFMIVRDFLSILDNVCKEVRVLQDNAVMGSARSFRLPPTASLPVLNRYNVKQGESSDEDQDSLSP